MILYDQTPESVLRAFLLHTLTGEMYCRRQDFHSQPSLFTSQHLYDTSQHTATSLLAQLRPIHNPNLDWLLASPGQTIARLTLGNLRFTRRDQEQTIFAALAESRDKGYTYTLCGAGRHSKIFLNRSRTVGREIHRMLGLLRWRPYGQNCQIARPLLFHNTADLILRKSASRYPDQQLVLLLPDHALSLLDGHLEQLPLQNFAADNSEDPFSSYWETYYHSQYISTRKNIRLAGHVLPRRYWNWLPEGHILQKEEERP